MHNFFRYIKNLGMLFFYKFIPIGKQKNLTEILVEDIGQTNPVGMTYR
jgi:hypothetical protein